MQYVIIHNHQEADLVIEIDEKQDGKDADEDESGPVGVVDGVVGVPAQRRGGDVVLVVHDLARVVDVRQRVDRPLDRLIRRVRRQFNPEEEKGGVSFHYFDEAIVV